ncbi:putative ATP-dependent RNA helicase DDX27 [Platysternon megacephalum]|uniref:Putative ATP-dependent RNA helicase DDX27 n=1 Tax=Platysternon megacephalum TaxID=55544 RepID=A0A4D9E4Q5_9SAUR|nr:putative ATP-dependent RNA helicase DDX27 [Platysternon megacephalum]
MGASLGSSAQKWLCCVHGRSQPPLDVLQCTQRHCRGPEHPASYLLVQVRGLFSETRDGSGALRTRIGLSPLSPTWVLEYSCSAKMPALGTLCTLAMLLQGSLLRVSFTNTTVQVQPAHLSR